LWATDRHPREHGLSRAGLTTSISNVTSRNTAQAGTVCDFPVVSKIVAIKPILFENVTIGSNLAHKQWQNRRLGLRLDRGVAHEHVGGQTDRKATRTFVQRVKHTDSRMAHKH
jgi:hypothetical protein